ncbi:MAG: hypothetical protein JXA69_16575, partial [Phycisphaerae bacterium]|nr:hypothetical protein [Phycisphaerae bacterium]
DLVTEPDPWPGFVVNAGIVSAAVLVIGTLLLTRPLTVPAAGIAGTAAFLLTARRWNANLAEIAMVLMTVMVGSVAMLGAMPERWTSNDYPLLFQRALYALAIMTFIWHWLAGFWLQQLDDGRPWTTSGRMIPVARRVGFMVAAIGVLVALHLAAWPKMRLVTDPDRSLGSWIRGSIGIGLLLVAVTYATLQTRKPTLGWLSAMVAGTGVVFVLVRSSGSEGYLWCMRHGPLLLACAAPVIGALPILLRMRATNPYREMLTFGGGVFVPLVALAMLFMMEESQLAGRWLTAATLGVLAVWYAVLATRPVLRDALWFALALANLTAVDLWSQRGFSVQFVSVVTAILVAASGLCLVGVYWKALGRPVMRLLAVVAAGATGVLAAVAVTGFRGL